MEAMFDRMDAIGKGVLGLTIQCAQCHTHKYDPLTQEEYYRLFAFLNNDHEAQRRRLHARRADAAGRHLPADRRDRGRPAAHARPTGPSGWPRGRTRSQDGQPEWTVVRPTVDDISTGGQKYLPQTDGSFLAQGYAPTKHTRQADGEDRPATDITAFRLELLNDPNLPLRRAGPLDQGHVRPDRVRRRSRRRPTTPARSAKVKLADGHRRRRTRRDAARADLRRQERARSASPGRSPSPSTARTRPPGASTSAPAAATVPRKAVFVAREADRATRGGTMLTFYLDAEPRRLEQRRQPEQQPRPLPPLGHRRRRTPTPIPLPAARPRDPRRSRASSASPAQVAAVFSYWRTTVPEWKEANDADRGALEAAPGRARRSWCSQARDEPRTTQPARARRLPQARPRPSTPGVPGVPAPAAGGRAADAPDVRALAGRSASRRRPRGRSSTASGRRTSAPASSRTSEDLGTQSEAPSHPELLDWLAVEFMDNGWSLKQLHRLIVTSATYRQSSRRDAGAAARATRTTGCSPAARASASKPRSSATSRWRRAGC